MGIGGGLCALIRRIGLGITSDSMHIVENKENHHAVFYRMCSCKGILASEMICLKGDSCSESALVRLVGWFESQVSLCRKGASALYSSLLVE